MKGFLLVAVFGALIFLPKEEGWKPAPFPKKRHKFVVVAHRGDHTQAPENTLEALQNAIRSGADYVELDIRNTKDRQMVIMHDRTVDRTTNGKGAVSDLTFAEFRALQIVDKRFPNRPPEPPPTFEEMLRAARGKIYLYLDTKDVVPKEVCALLKKTKMERSVVVYCGDDDVKAWREANPKLPLMISPPKPVKSLGDLETFWKATPIEILDGPYYDYNLEGVEAAKRLRAEVWPDIQNPGENPKQWGDALATGVQGLQTDHPAALIAYLVSIGRR